MSSSTFHRHCISLPSLPDDIFVQILADLEAWDVVRCQKVSRSWREAFLEPEYLQCVLKRYPLTREIRQIPQSNADVDWRAIFNCIACRYYHLAKGRASRITKHKLRPIEQYGQWFPIGQWDYHESQPGGRLYYENAATHLTRLGNKPYLFRATLWSYDDGLLACAPLQDTEQYRATESVLSILDVESGVYSTVPFNPSGKVIRNVTLRSHALVVEWCERDPYHDLNDNEKVHRHFATCYDVSRCRVGWEVTFRNEWKMHFLGLPLNVRDRFFSTHNGKHYAVYFWQPNRSMYTGDEDMPIEALAVWDISRPCPHLPSADPTSKSYPAEEKRPHLVARFSFRELDFIGVRQHSNISLMSLHLDSENHSLTVKENVCVAGQGYFDPAERLMQATTTTFLFAGEGPALRHEMDRDLPPYRGHCSMESFEIEDIERWFAPIMDVYDPVADVRFSLVETCFTGQGMLNTLLVRIKSLNQWSLMEDSFLRQITSMGRIVGDERWIIGQNAQMEIVVLKF